jgi:isopentenyl phosphate kinase
MLTLLKLGGSLITDKSRPRTPRPEVLMRLAQEIAQACQKAPELQLILGHGSGSFGHVVAERYGTRQGVYTSEQWKGFVEVWREALALNRLVVKALEDVGLPVFAFPPSASAIAKDGKIVDWNLQPIQAALRAALVPVVYGDVAFDQIRGGTILSTEDIFGYLAARLPVKRILLAGLEPGVWADYPTCSRLVTEITAENIREVLPALGGARGRDVTGGMASKVQQSLAWVQEIPALQVLIFSAEIPMNLERAMLGEAIGTLIHHPQPSQSRPV